MTVDQKIKKIEEDLAELLHNAAVKGLKDKVSPFIGVVGQDKYDESILKASFFHKVRATTKKARKAMKDINWYIDGTHVVEMDLGKREEMYASISSSQIERDTNAYYKRQGKIKILLNSIVKWLKCVVK